MSRCVLKKYKRRYNSTPILKGKYTIKFNSNGLKKNDYWIYTNDMDSMLRLKMTAKWENLYSETENVKIW